MAKGISERQKKFAEYYYLSGNATDAAIKAGYSKKYAGPNAGKLLKNTKVLDYLNNLRKMGTAKTILTAQERQEILSEIARLPYKTSDRIKAIDVLNKMTGEYVENINVSGDLNNPFEALSTDELKKLIGDG